MALTVRKNFNAGLQGVVADGGDPSTVVASTAHPFEGSGHVRVTVPVPGGGAYVQSRIRLVDYPGSTPTGPVLSVRVDIAGSTPDHDNWHGFIIWQDNSAGGYAEHRSLAVNLTGVYPEVASLSWPGGDPPPANNVGGGGTPIEGYILQVYHDGPATAGTLTFDIDMFQQGDTGSGGGGSPADVAPPSISNARVATGDIAHNSAVVRWDTDEAADSLVEIGTVTSNGTGGTGMERLIVSGGNIARPNGTAMKLKGANVGEYTIYDYMGSSYSVNNDPINAMIPKMKSYGMNMTLFGISSDAVLGDSTHAGNGQFVPRASYLAFTDNLVAKTKANGMYLSLGWRNEIIDTDQPPRPTSRGEQAMTFLATRYKEEPHIIWSTQVEPHDNTWESLLTQWTRMVDAIRAATAPYEPPVMVSGPEWGRDLRTPASDPSKRVNRPNIIYKWHFYIDYDGTFATNIGRWVPADDAGLATFCGEFGEGMATQLLNEMHNRGIGYTAWHWSPSGPPEMLQGYPSQTLTPFGQLVVNDIAARPASTVQVGNGTGTTTTWAAATPLTDAPASTAGKTTGHAATLTNLAPSTSYRVRIKTKDASGNEATGPELTFSTTAAPDNTGDTVPPVISAIAVPNNLLTANSAAVTWTTDELASTQLVYGLSAAYGQQTGVLDTSPRVLNHSVTLTGLTAATTYHYAVRSTDAAGNLATSTDRAFTTAPAVDTTAPAISGVQVSALTTTGATIGWSTNEPATTALEYGTSTGYGTTVPQPADPTRRTAHSLPLTGLTPNTTYHARVRATDAAGNLALSGDIVFATPAVATGPVVLSISPASRPAGNGAFTETVDGTGFTPSSVVRWNGHSRATTYVSPTRLTALILAEDVAQQGESEVTVT